jgi:hypothetical protein
MLEVEKQMKLTIEQYKALNSGKRSSRKQLEKRVLQNKVRSQAPDPREKNYPEDLEGLTEGERKLMKR